MTITIANTSAGAGFPLEITLEGMQVKSAVAEILTGAIQDHNEFEKPETVKPVKLAAEISNGCVKVIMPACSVAMVRLR